MSQRFAGKVVIVTGAGRGMGRTIAGMFCAEGAKVMVAARTVSYGEEAVASFRQQGAEASLCQVDVTRPEDIAKLIDATVAAYGGVDIVVHSAAEVINNRVIHATDEDVERQLASGIKAAFWLTRYAHPYLARSDAGRLVFLSSISGPRTAIPGQAAYGAAKAGLNAFIAVAALELAEDRITVNGVEPGVTSTDRMRSMLNDAEVKAIAATVPLLRVGEPEDISHAVMFLASKEAAYITGRTITVDGGLSLSTTNLASATDPA